MDKSVFDDQATRRVIEQLFAQDIRYIRLYFLDPLGRLKGQNISRDGIWDVLQRGQGFDGSSIEGFVRIHESDTIAMPMPHTFRVMPYPVNGQKVGMMFCQIINTNGKRFVGDSFYALERALDKARDMGFSEFYVGPEMEFFYFQRGSLASGKPELVHTGGYYDEAITHSGAVARMKTVEALRELGIVVEGDHGEVADSQNEINLHYTTAQDMAWIASLYRIVVKEIAVQQGFEATFMPKPIAGVNGSGMHVHQSLFQDGRNAFFDKDDKIYHLSTIARQYMAGMFKYLPEGLIILCQWVNSYKRLVPGYEAPVYLCWGEKNRSALIRVPQYQKGLEKATRIELRCPDPGCNLPLAFAVMLRMGLQGIEDKLDTLPDPVEDDVFKLTEAERKERHIESLPESFKEALARFKTSKFMKRVLGTHLHTRICESKVAELKRYEQAIGDDGDVSSREKIFTGEVKMYSRWL